MKKIKNNRFVLIFSFFIWIIFSSCYLIYFFHPLNKISYNITKNYFPLSHYAIAAEPSLTITLGKKPVYIEPAGGTSIIQSSEKIPFGLTTPFEIEKYDFSKPSDKAQVDKFMQEIDDIGVNVISSHFGRAYGSDGNPDFSLHEKEIKLFIVDHNKYFWGASRPRSIKCFLGDIDGTTRQIITTQTDLNNAINGRHKCVPYSAEGLAEYENWLTQSLALFDKYPGSINKFAYFQIGNEEDQWFEKKDIPDPTNPNDWYHEAYAKIIERAYPIIKNKAPNTKVVIGTLGSGSIAVEGFYQPALQDLSGKCGGTGCFDLFDYHVYGPHTTYNERPVIKAVTILKSYRYFRNLLDNNEFSNKGLVIQQGGTYTGSDIGWSEPYQDETVEAMFLVKRMVYNKAQGMEQDQIVSLIELFCFADSIHNPFTIMGLEYNGSPVPGGTPSCLDTSSIPTQYDCGTNPKQEPCPDPGFGLKKLSYWTYKFLIEKLRGNDWNNIEKIKEVDNIYLYKFTKQGQPVYVAWWDWFNETGETKTVTLDLAGFPTNQAKITEAVPDVASGISLNSSNYPNFFYSYTKNLTSTDTTPPVRSLGFPTGTLASGTIQTTLSLATNENATCKYSTIAGTAYSSMANTFSTTGGTNHSKTITGLTNGTTYNYYSRCQDTVGNSNIDDYIITFLVASSSTDTTPPTISLVSASSIASNSATITWQTNENSDSQIEYGLTLSYGISTTPNTSMLTSHSVSLSGLSDSTLYHYRVKSKDQAGNLATSADYTFITKASVGSDTTSPTVPVNLSATAVSSSQINLSWTASTDNIGVTGYQIERCQGTNCSNFSLFTTSSPTTYSNTGLSPSTVYRYQIKAHDAAGNVSVQSNIASGTTLTQTSLDITSPQISDISVSNLTNNSATINWTTNEPADSQVEYGSTLSYGSQTSLNTNLVTSHLVNLNGLSTSTIYYYRVKSKDASGNLNTPQTNIFITKSAFQGPPAYPDGTILKTTTSPDIYVIKDDKRELIPNWLSFQSFGYNLNTLRVIPSSEMTKIEAIDLAKLDSDNDKLTNDQERRYGTNAAKADTDGDGYNDYLEISKGYSPLIPAITKSGPVFAYGKPRLSSLADEQERAKILRSELEKKYTKNQIQGLSAKNWITVVNSYIYGGYPLEAIVKALKYGGKTVHPTIPWSVWSKSRDYLNYIEK